MTGPRSAVADVAEAQMPNARARAGPSNSAVRIASEPGTSSGARRAPWRRRARTSSSSVGARPHRTDIDAEADEADGEDRGAGRGSRASAPPRMSSAARTAR